MTETNAHTMTEGKGLGENLEQRLYSLAPIAGSAFGEVVLRAVAFDYLQLAERLGIPKETASVILSASDDLVVYKKRSSTGHERNVLLVDKDGAVPCLKIKDTDVWKEYVLIPWTLEGTGLYLKALYDNFVGADRILMRLVKIHGLHYVLVDGMEKQIEKEKINSAYAQLDDGSLVGLVKEGDTAAWEELYSRNYRRVFGFMLPRVRDEEITKDVVQEAFLRAYKYIDRYNGESSFCTWVTTIAKNATIDLFRRQKPVHKYWVAVSNNIGLSSHSQWSLDTHNGYDTVSKSELHAAVHDALDNVTDKYREILHLRHFEDLSYQEIAARLAIPEGTVMSRLFYARRAVEKYMKEKYPDPI